MSTFCPVTGYVRVMDLLRLRHDVRVCLHPRRHLGQPLLVGAVEPPLSPTQHHEKDDCRHCRHLVRHWYPRFLLTIAIAETICQVWSGYRSFP